MRAALLGDIIDEKLPIPVWAGLLLIVCGLLTLTIATQLSQAAGETT